MTIRLAVGFGTATETIALHTTLKATPLGRTFHVNEIAFFKNVGFNHVTERISWRNFLANLAQFAQRRRAFSGSGLTYGT